MKDDILLFGFLVGVVCLAAGIVALSIKQIIDLRHQAELRHKMRCLRRPKQPWVTIIVDALGKSDSESALTLRALEKVHYYNYDVVIVKGLSLSRHQTAIALRGAYQKSQRGSVVVVLTAGELVDRAFVKRAVVSQGRRATWRVATNINGVSDEVGQLTGIIRMLEINYWQIFHTGRVFTAQDFVSNENRSVFGWRYDMGARGALNLLVFVAVSLAVVVTGELKLFWYIWLIFAAYGLGVIWLQNRQTLRVRLILTYSVPLAPLLLPVASAVHLFLRIMAAK